MLQYVDDNLLHASSKMTLESSEVKFVAKRILQALQALHHDGYTHTGKLFTAPVPLRLLAIALTGLY